MFFLSLKILTFCPRIKRKAKHFPAAKPRIFPKKGKLINTGCFIQQEKVPTHVTSRCHMRFWSNQTVSGSSKNSWKYLRPWSTRSKNVVNFCWHLGNNQCLSEFVEDKDGKIGCKFTSKYIAENMTKYILVAMFFFLGRFVLHEQFLSD